MAENIEDIFSSERAALAPLAGVSDSLFRKICVGFGACPVMTEMVSSEGFIRSNEANKSTGLLEFSDLERPIGFQFFGANPEVMAAAAEKAHDFNPDFIDINAGCPVKKVISKGSGSALMRNPQLLAKIVGKVAGVSKVPVTVKIRSGWDHSSINAVEVARICVDAGAQAVIVHPRTKSDGFGGLSDWSLIREVRETISVPVIGSGDINNHDDALRMKNETGIDYVMVGRSAMGNPWIFREINEYLTGKPLTQSPAFGEKLELPLKQLEQLAETIPERFAVLKMRKFFGWYSKGAIGGSVFRQNIFRDETIEEVRNTVREFREELEKQHVIG
ncbi:tRNA dihydrouridine synthase DusB [Candidatus Latescibacterota bacterium]